MNVRVTYKDNESYTLEEAVAKARNIFGTSAKVEVLPEDTSIDAFLFYAMQA